MKDKHVCGHCNTPFIVDFNNRNDEIGCGSGKCDVWWCCREHAKLDGYINTGDAYEPGYVACNHCKDKPEKPKRCTHCGAIK